MPRGRQFPRRAFLQKSWLSYRHYHRYPRFPPTNRYAERLRMTEQQAAQDGLRPTSVFRCVGASQVGTGSVAGMRVLHEISARVQGRRIRQPVSIWPFDISGVPVQSTIVEIYPRLFLNHAGDGNYFGAKPQNVPANDDQRDALVSAAGMAWFIQRGLVAWQVPD